MTLLEHCGILGVDIGGTKTALVAGTQGGEILGRIEYPTKPDEGYSQWQSSFTENLRQLEAETLAWSPGMAGISVGGPADWVAGVLQAPPNLSTWISVPIRDDIARVSGLPCKMEHDGRAGALAEHRWGAGKGLSNIIFLTFGTGIGAGLILNGSIYRGADGAAGEIGHVRLADDGPTAYGKIGSAEAFASGTGIARLGTHFFPGTLAGLSAKDIVERAESGDADAVRVLEISAGKLGQVLALLADLINPEMIILGSLASHLPQWYLDEAESVLRSEALAANSGCRIAKSALGSRLQDLAAIAAALEGL